MRGRMRKYGRRVAAAAAVAIVAAVAALLAMPSSADAKPGEGTIAAGVYIGSVYVGGMTETEAKAALQAYAEGIEDASFTFTAGGGSMTVAASDLGITVQTGNAVREALAVGNSGGLIKQYKDKKDLEYGDKVLEISYEADDDMVAEVVASCAAAFDEDAVDNGLVREDGAFRFVAGTEGIAVDEEESVALLEDYISGEWDGTSATVALAADVVEPRGTEEELAKVQDVLGSYHTNFSSSTQNRCTNIETAAALLNGTVLYPGEELSVNAAIGPLDESMGYELAASYENGQTVQSYGGGVCQVSTTLYNAVIRAELSVTQRSNHSMIVTYVEPSMDAALAGDYKDLKFVNNLDTPIYIEGYTSGKELYFNIYGEETRPANRVVSFESEIVSEDDPAPQIVATTDPVGTINVTQSKHIGYVARLWKVVTVDGVEESRDIFNNSTYKASPKIIQVGTASSDENISAIIGAAIATGDEATVYATVAQYAASTVTEPEVSAEEQAIIAD